MLHDQHDIKAPIRPDKLALSAFIIFTLLVLTLVPIHISFLEYARPQFLIIATFYIAVFSPALISALGLFGLGLIQDVILGTPFGFHGFILIAVYMGTTSQNSFLIRQPFPLLWLMFGILAFVVGGVEFLMTSLLRLSFADVSFSLWQWVLTSMSFPVVAAILYWTTPGARITLPERFQSDK